MTVKTSLVQQNSNSNPINLTPSDQNLVVSGSDAVGRKAITTEASERAKASASYGIARRIHYGIILPIKEKLMVLTSEQKKNLDLYRAHVALCDQVDKVKRAFKAYRTAQKTADKIPPLDPKLAIPRKGARQEARAAGINLVKRYDQLIKLAIDQVDTHGLNKNDCLDDIQDELGKGTEEYILQTVNQLRARQPVESGAFARSPGTKIALHYRNFVMDFVSHVHAANNASSGDHIHPQEISRAFIQGLASIPELAEGLTLIELHNQLNTQSYTDTLQDEQLQYIVDHFSKRLENLINKPEDVTSDALKSIHYHGVTLSSVLPTVTAETLNTFKKTRKELKEATEKLTQAKSELAQNQKIIADKTDYSFKDVEAFFEEIGKDMKVSLDGVGTNTTAISKLADAKKQRSKLIEDIVGRISVLTEERKKITNEGYAELEKLEKTIKQTQSALRQIEEEIAGQKDALDKMTAELGTLTEQYLEYSKKEMDPGLTLMNEIAKKGTQAAADYKAQMAKVNERQTQEEALNTAETDKSALKTAFNDEINKCTEMLRSLEKENQALRADTMITLSGKEVAEIAQHLGIGNLASPKSRIGVTLSKTEAAATKVARLEKEAKTHEKEIERLNALEESQPVVVKDLIGKKEVQEGIKDQIASNLAFAKAVTVAVGREVVKNDEKFFQSQQPPSTQMTSQQRRAAQRISPLAPELDKIPRSHVDLHKEISERVNMLPRSVTAAPAPIPGEAESGNPGAVRTPTVPSSAAVSSSSPSVLVLEEDPGSDIEDEFKSLSSSLNNSGVEQGQNPKGKSKTSGILIVDGTEDEIEGKGGPGTLIVEDEI